jgi:hypothetical protein
LRLVPAPAAVWLNTGVVIDPEVGMPTVAFFTGWEETADDGDDRS